MITAKRKAILIFLVTIALLFVFSACGKQAVSGNENLWDSAAYLTDTELGQGSKTVLFEVNAGDRTIQFTIHTEKETVGAALLENGLIDGEESQYGLNVKVVNGMTADYSIDQSYWAFYVDDEYAMSGVDTTDIVEGAVYRFAYTK